MSVEWKVVAGLGLVLAPWAVVYWVFSYDPAGTAALVTTVVAFLFLAVYLAVQARHTGRRPEDRPDASPGDDAGEVGFFPTSSVWPVTIAGGCTILAYGAVFTWWIALPGAALLVAAIAGLAVEAHRATGGHGG